MAAIDNVRLPDDIEAGAEIGPSFQTSIIEMTSGHEQRNQDWSGERLRANISYGMMRDRNDVVRPDGEIDRTFMEVLAFYRARRGMARGFLFRDWSDYTADDVVIGNGDGANRNFQLAITYEDTGGSYVRKISRPVASTLKVFVEGVQSSAWQLGPLGLVTFNADAIPAIGDEITADFEFDIPVRFNSDVMQVQMAWSRAGEIRDIELIGLREL